MADRLTQLQDAVNQVFAPYKHYFWNEIYEYATYIMYFSFRRLAIYFCFRDVSATLRFAHSLYLISMDEETECRSLYFSRMDY